MVYVKASTKYGGLNIIKKNTPSFARSFRGLLSILESVSDEMNCSPETALLLLSEHLPLGEFKGIDDPVYVDIRHDEQLRRFLDKAIVGTQQYLISVIETVLRLNTTDMTAIVAQFDLARMKLNGFVIKQTDKTNEQTKQPVDTSDEEPKPRKRFKTKKVHNPEQPQEVKPPVIDKLSKLDDSLKRSKAALARSKETLAESGQVVVANPLLNDFL